MQLQSGKRLDFEPSCLLNLNVLILFSVDSLSFSRYVMIPDANNDTFTSSSVLVLLIFSQEVLSCYGNTNVVITVTVNVLVIIVV